MTTVTVTHPPNDGRGDAVIRGCPATFDAEPYTVVSESSYDAPAPDARGQHPTWAEHLAALGVALTAAQWDALRALPPQLARNPEWTPTYERRVPAGDTSGAVEHQVADCPSCGTPIKVG